MAPTPDPRARAVPLSPAAASRGRRRLLRGLGGGAVALLLQPRRAFAQGGDRTIRLILPISAGSGADGVARAMTGALGKSLGHAVVVENLPGAGGIPGTQQIVKAPRDGFTLGLVSNNHVVNPSIYKSMPYDAVADITPVTVIGSTPFVLVAHPSVPAKNIPELLALARVRPGALNYASSGNGTIIQLAAEMLRDEAKIDIRHIPYRGTGPMVTDLLGGQVQLGVLAINVAMPHLKSGALRALGLTSAKRSPLLPELPAIAEQGLPRYAIEGWIAVIGPAGLGRADTDRIYRAFKETVETPEVRDVLLAQGYTLQSLPPDATAAWFRSERDRMAALVRQAGVKID